MGLINLYDESKVPIDMKALGLKGLKLEVPSPSYELMTAEDIPGRGGMMVIDKQLKPRELIADFFFDSRDYTDSLLLRDEIYRVLSHGKEIYVSESKLPNKRWKVHVGEWAHERINPRVGTFSIPLIVSSGLSESTGTTLDPLTFPAEKWQVGQGLILEEPKYAHSSTTFRIFNAGDVAIDPRQMLLKIIYRGASTNLKINNITTGDAWAHTGASSTSDTLTLDGVRSLKNGVSVFKNTNKKLITIAPGWNDFTLTGASGSFLISFEHRFYYY